MGCCILNCQSDGVGVCAISVRFFGGVTVDVNSEFAFVVIGVVVDGVVGEVDVFIVVFVGVVVIVANVVVLVGGFRCAL